MRRIAFLLCTIVALSSCVYGNHVVTEVTPIGDERFAPTSGDILVFFGPSEPSFPYIQIAHVQMTGMRTSTIDDLLQGLRKKAASLGADALIFVERTYVTREVGVLFIGDPDYYDAAVLSGIAVRYAPEE